MDGGWIVGIVVAILGAGGLGALLPKVLPGWYKFLERKRSEADKRREREETGLLGEIARLQLRVSQVESDHLRCLKDNADLRERLGRTEEAVRRLEGVKTVALVVCDEQQIIREANNGVLMLLGWNPDDLLGQPIHVLIPPRFRGTHSEAFTAACLLNAKPATTIREGLALHSNGEEVPVTISMSSWMVGTQEVTKRMFAAEIRRR